ISKHSLEKVYETERIVEVMQDILELKHAGVNLKGLSPIVNEKTPPNILPQLQQSYQDSSSGKERNVVNFLIESQQMSYPEAIEYLSKRYNIELEYENAEIAEKKKVQAEKKESLRSVLTKVHEMYIAEFKKLSNNHAAKQEIYNHR